MVSGRPLPHRRKATRACDLCKVRKRQCTFETEAAPNCQKCTRMNLKCTFLGERKTRGPRAVRSPNERLELVCRIELERLCTLDTMHRIIADFSTFIYPLFPLVHLPSLRTALEAEAYRTDAAFLRRCFALSAITVACMPSNMSEYGGRLYDNVQSMVDRASALVTMSRVAEDPAWQDKPSIDSMIDSMFLCIGMHYSGRPNTGWSFCNEAMVSCSSLQMHKKETHSRLNRLDSEWCKRAFWVLYSFQCFDRFVSVTPHTLLAFPPDDTDWEYLQLADTTDEELSQIPHEPPSSHSPASSTPHTPLIAGFIAYIALFQRLRQITCIPISCRSPYELFPQGYPLDHIGDTYPAAANETLPAHFTTHLDAIGEMRRHFEAATMDLPLELRVPGPASTSALEPLASEFHIAKANIHITSLYIQSVLLENIIHVQLLPALPSARPDEEGSSTLDTGTEMLLKCELWKYRSAIAQGLLSVLEHIPKETLERNSFAFVLAIRKVASTLLDPDGDMAIPDYMKEGVVSESYVQQFAEILAPLDCNAPLSLRDDIENGFIRALEQCQ